MHRIAAAVFLVFALASDARATDAPQPGDPVRIETVSGQIVEGELVEKLPNGYLIRVEVRKSETRVISYDLVRDIAKTDGATAVSSTPVPSPTSTPAPAVAVTPTPAATPVVAATPAPIRTPRAPGTGDTTTLVGANLQLRTFDYFGETSALDGDLRISAGRLIRGTHEVGGVLGYAIQQREIPGASGKDRFQDVSLTWLLAAYSYHRPMTQGSVPLVLYAGPLVGLVSRMATGVDTATDPAIGAQAGLLVQPAPRWAIDLRFLQADQVFSDDSHMILGTSIGARVSF